MKYIYKMSRKMYLDAALDATDNMYLETARGARRVKISVEKYITEHFGLLGECAKVETI